MTYQLTKPQGANFKAVIIEQLLAKKIKLPSVKEARERPEQTAALIQSLILCFVQGSEALPDYGVQLKTETALYKIGSCDGVPEMITRAKNYQRLAENKITLDCEGVFRTYRQFCAR